MYTHPKRDLDGLYKIRRVFHCRLRVKSYGQMPHFICQKSYNLFFLFCRVSIFLEEPNDYKSSQVDGRFHGYAI